MSNLLFAPLRYTLDLLLNGTMEVHVSSLKDPNQIIDWCLAYSTLQEGAGPRENAIFTLRCDILYQWGKQCFDRQYDPVGNSSNYQVILIIMEAGMKSNHTTLLDGEKGKYRVVQLYSQLLLNVRWHLGILQNESLQWPTVSTELQTQSLRHPSYRGGVKKSHGFTFHNEPQQHRMLHVSKGGTSSHNDNDLSCLDLDQEVWCVILQGGFVWLSSTLCSVSISKRWTVGPSPCFLVHTSTSR